MSTLDQLYLLTFNCNKILDLGFVQQVQKTFPKDLPCIAAFAFQEVCSVFDSTNTATVNKYLIDINEMLTNSLREHYEVDFQTIAIEHIGALGLIVITPFASKMGAAVRSAKTSCGMGYSSLKGGCGVRFSYNNQEYTVVAAHLNANEGLHNWNRRDKDCLKILSALDFKDGYGVIKPRNHVFFMGDLNYRVIQNSSTGGSDEGELYVTNYSQIQDELQTSISRGTAFWGFKEAPITFRPTYKFFNNTSDYNLKRYPSWCDRILFLEYKKGAMQVNKYGVVPDVLTSDHIPVYLDFCISREPPKGNLITSEGYLIENKAIYLKPSFSGKIGEALCFIADHSIFTGLYLTTTTRGRIILALMFMAITSRIYF